ncbi:alpha-glucan family phosphorylase [Chitinophaga silvisoli]|uniref:Alpha-glucan family phosphorylase n=1 Tax=Chitinophaga silvisoli TaxID=2291814 RepID=A0A3E1NUC0_9BACT|nr:alpha-glucan family phosphorylase [Chitinophaga silvisoli]RFM31503.1 alpha-glucan family phosphorylase [Chitinophaga silvisoli]
MTAPMHELISPNYLFEVSWEVCNKVGGIYTVISTKATLVQKQFGNRYILIGPDLIRHEGNIPGFIEDNTLFYRWKAQAGKEGLNIKTGRWNIEGSPLVILIDFSTFYSKKDEIFGDLWVHYRLDSITGQWDYIDPALFGYAAGVVIDSYYKFHLNATDRIVAHFHEWMTGAGVLYIEKYVPQVATIFTTHATVLGRALAGAGIIPDKIQPDVQAATFHLTAKHSLEKNAATNADCFCCVSEITASECLAYLGKAPDIITPNGFNHPVAATKPQSRQQVRDLLTWVATSLLKENTAPDTLFIFSAGRYEFHNKGLDLLIDAMGALKKKTLHHPVILFLFIPAGHTGPRVLSANDAGPFSKILTHNLYSPDKDDICKRLLFQDLVNNDSSPVRVIFAPVYLDGNDGIFNLPYYNVLSAFDLAIFPSFYEPWGYTPMESLANGIYTITSDKAGFAQAVAQLPKEATKGLFIINRHLTENMLATEEIANCIVHYMDLSKDEQLSLSANAQYISAQFTWEKCIDKYKTAWHFSLNKSLQREYLFHDKPATRPPEIPSVYKPEPKWREINISSSTPEQVHELYATEKNQAKAAPAIAYFCMEYGIHPALTIYAGGLGILAGDYLKTASDLNLPVIAVGLFYRQGYFRQQLTDSGQQIILKEQLDPTTLPLQEVKHHCGDTLQISLSFPGRQVWVKAWKAKVGNTMLYLLDSDIITNMPDDRLITGQLYPAEKEYRLQQEIILGIGGVRLISELGLSIDVYHCNEGHAAFLSLERIRQLIATSHLTFAEAAEIVRSSQLFTTHTSALAAMDTYDETLLHTYLAHIAKECFISWEQLFSLGSGGNQDTVFSMFCLAARTSQLINAVSCKHKTVTAQLLGPLWKNYLPMDLPLIAVTNGIHLPTWVAPEWQQVFQQNGLHLTTPDENWEKLKELADAEIWATRLSVKKRCITEIRELLSEQFTRHHYPAEKITNFLAQLQPTTMFIGYARRITHYKRADLLYYDIDRLTRLLHLKDRPVILIIAGKAHPADIEGQKILEKVFSLTSHNNILFLENYDIKIAQLLTQGVDCWLNLPIRDTEACGTSGMKALVNGVLNFSTPDGWWAEFYTPETGWALSSHSVSANEDTPDQRKVDAEELYNLLEHHIIPLYYTRDEHDIPTGWTAMIRNAFVHTAPKISSTRMMTEYYYYYKKLHDHTLALSIDNYYRAKSVASWKEKISNGWNSIQVLQVSPEKGKLLSGKAGDTINFIITIDTGVLSTDDIGVDVIFTSKHGDQQEVFKKELLLTQRKDAIATYSANITLIKNGEYNLTCRIYARNILLMFKTEIPLVLWT